MNLILKCTGRKCSPFLRPQDLPECKWVTVYSEKATWWNACEIELRISKKAHAAHESFSANFVGKLRKIFGAKFEIEVTRELALQEQWVLTSG